jgi:nicotinic acid mononucleotide adenylyltransferase
VNWKIARDPYLRRVAERWGEAAVWDAGFFADDDDADAPLDDVHWLCTPVTHVAAAVREAEPGAVPVVLLATGGFWPPHAGHVEMLEAARATLERQPGVAVVGGYLSPGHDRYLRLKWGDAAPPAAARLTMLEGLLAPHPWLAVDPWEAQHRRTSVNFTDVVARLEAYLRHHVDPRLEVAYVCGGDNARFALAFADHGRCVVVGRPGSEAEVATWKADARTSGSRRITWAAGASPAASSAMDPGRWQPPEPPRLRLRCEDQRVVDQIGLGEDRWRSFQGALHARLARHQQVSPVRVEDQRLAPDPDGLPTISLDPLTPGTADLAVSRRFDLGGRRLLGLGERPDHPPVGVQVARIAPGRYVLVDDDRVTGSTLEFVLRSLPAGVEVADQRTLMPPADGEIADSRDFLLGAADGGLVVCLPDGSLGRAPYLLPYVDPGRRCGVPAHDVLALSIDVWRCNVDAFAGSAIAVRDLPPAAQRLLAAAGHEPEALVEAVCRDHAATLEAYRWGSGAVGPAGRL